MIEQYIMNNPGILIFAFLWVSGTMMYAYTKDKLILEVAMQYSIVYGLFRIIMLIVT